MHVIVSLDTAMIERFFIYRSQKYLKKFLVGSFLDGPAFLLSFCAIGCINLCANGCGKRIHLLYYKLLKVMKRLHDLQLFIEWIF